MVEWKVVQKAALMEPLMVAQMAGQLAVLSVD